MISIEMYCIISVVYSVIGGCDQIVGSKLVSDMCQQEDKVFSSMDISISTDTDTEDINVM